MGFLSLFSVKEAANKALDHSWTEKTALNVAAGAHASVALTKKCNAIRVYTQTDIYIRFDNSSSDTITANSQIMPALSSERFEYPSALDGHLTTVYFHAKGVHAAVTGVKVYVVEL